MSPVTTSRKAANAVAWVVLAVGMLVLGVQVSRNYEADADDRAVAAEQRAIDAQRDADQLCEKVADQNQKLTDFLAISSAPRTPPPGATPAQIEGYRVTNEEREKLRALGATIFEPDVCADGVPPPTFAPTTSTGTTTP